ncbi:hypothetical protein [Lewinella sp. IMCC34183]|uniref:hypothetical protein n=1 Tax=Lewinella sp. IMCC34183 TaxID=2248762 RepID=UPI000E229C8C|nr:hypothetical protein [Lewinella sp. IMCC34183]
MIRPSLLLLFLLYLSHVGTQVLSNRDSLPPTTIVTTRFYGGHRGFWCRQFTDDRGRTVREESYRRTELRGVTLTTYNQRGDVTHLVQSFDINNPGIDTTLRTVYRYGPPGQILRQTDRLGYDFLRMYRLTAMRGDTLLYTEHHHHDRSPPHTTDTALVILHRLVRDAGGRLTYHSTTTASDGSTVRITFQYNGHGDLARRKIAREPALREGIETLYVGGPAADDQAWSYRYDRHGRIRRKYTTITGVKLLTARYRYRTYRTLPTQYGETGQHSLHPSESTPLP